MRPRPRSVALVPNQVVARAVQNPNRVPHPAVGPSMGGRTVCARLALTIVSLGLFLGGVNPGRSQAQEFSPESPEVKALITKGLKFLESQYDYRPGGEALVGLVYLKSGAPITHPRVQKAIEKIRESLSKPDPFALVDEMYTPCVELLFFTAADPKQFRSEIDQLLAYLITHQKPHGGWGYTNRPTGDTSMTQYAVLALWELSQIGIEVPVDVWERVANWLLRTQDPSGTFGYQGHDPGNFQRVAQRDLRHSMAVAGLGSVFICAHHLGLGGNAQRNTDISTALSRVEKEQGNKARRKLTSKVDASKVQAAQADGDQWMHANYAIPPSSGGYIHYFLYTLERYESFRELERGTVEEKYAWYDDGVRYLTRTQRPDGSWVSAANNVIDTAFATLFLLRSTQKSLGQAGLLAAGTLIGGRGLPKDLAGVQLRNGEIVAKPLSGPAEKLLSVLDNPADPAYLAAVEGFRELTLEADEATLSRQAVRLRKLAGGPEPEARLAAVHALARARDLDNVPILIYALSDPDPQVVATALEGLRFVSRKLGGLGDAPIRDEPTRRAAIERWKNWYRTVRPEATFDRE